MKDETLIEQIRNTAKAAQESGQSVSIDAVLPTVCVTRGVDDAFFFQEHEATELLKYVDNALANIGEAAIDISEEDYLLYLAQGW